MADKEVGRKILYSFVNMYYDKNHEVYRPSYAMLKMAEKIADFYTLSEMDEIMRYYFKHHDGDFYQFLNDLDVYYRNMLAEKEQEDNFSSLESQTKQLMKKIRNLKVGEDE